MFLACASESYSLINRNIVTDYSCLPDYNTMSVIDKKTFSNLCARVYFNSGLSCSLLRDFSCFIKFTFEVLFVCLSVFPYSPETRIKKYFPVGFHCRVPVFYDLYGFFNIFYEFHDISLILRISVATSLTGFTVSNSVIHNIIIYNIFNLANHCHRLG